MSTLKTTNLQHASAASPSIVLASDGTATAQLSSLNGGPLSGARNRIINGGMQVWQRGTTATGNYSSGYTYGSVDRWAVYSPNTSTTIAQSTSVPTTTGALFQYSLKLQRPSTNTGTGIIQIAQGIESLNCYDLSNQQVTLSFWAKTGANYSGGTLGILLNTGTAADQGIAMVNTWTGVASPINTVQSITTTWTKYSFTGTLGSGILEAAVQFSWTPTGTAGADDSVYITGVQLEVGSVATPFERRSYGQELALCQRYFVTGKGVLHTSNPAVTSTAFLPVQMRSTPTTVTTSLDSGTGGTWAALTSQSLYQSAYNSVSSGAAFTASAEL